MNRELATGDLITARIIAFDRTRDPMLTVQDRDLGKIPRGESLRISATRVPRLIGKRGSMIQTIEQATQTRVIIGQNGVVVVTGRNHDGIDLAVKAIKVVEEEAHTSNLTQRIKALLNVPDTTLAQPQGSEFVEKSSEPGDISEISQTKSVPNIIQRPITNEQQSQGRGEREQEHENERSATSRFSDGSSSPSSPSSSDVTPVAPSHKVRSQDERPRKGEEERISQGDTRKTKTPVKGVHDGLQEHGKKEGDN
jgi:exosome complex component RRP4